VHGPNFTKLGEDIPRSSLRCNFVSEFGCLATFSNASGSKLSDVENDAKFSFEPPFGDLGATYDDHLRLIGKRVLDLLLVLFDFSLCITAEVLGAIIGLKSAISLQRGPVDPKFQVEVVASHQPFFF